MIDGDNAEFLTKYGLFEDRQVFFTLVAAGKEDRAGFDTLANWAKSKGDDIFDLDLPRLVSEVLYLIEDHPVFERVAAIATLIEIYSEIETNLVDRYDYLTDGKAHCFHVHPEFDFFPDKYPLDRWGLSVPDPIYCLRRFNDYLKICQEDKLLNSEVEDHFEILGRNGHVQGLFTAYSPWEWESKLTYASLVVLRDRYLLRGKDRRIYETPSIMFLRVATQLGFSQVDLTDNVAEVFNIFETLSELRFMPSTPTLFNSGLRQPQLSSCYLTTIEDSIEGIYEGYLENAQLSKYAGGLGNDWTPVRASGAYIAGTNGESQGIVPFLKIANDSAVAVNQSGKRRGAVCAYLEVWHLDIMDFTELRKNDGASELRRTPQMHTAVWIPDLFMERVHEEGDWTLFSPDEPLTKDLHDLYGHDFKAAYLAAEKATKRGDGSVKLYKKIKAVDLWRQILTMLYSTGHAWVTFKDPCNMRSPLSHVGVVHSSNLCCVSANQRVITDRGVETVGEMYEHQQANIVMGKEDSHNASPMLLPRPNAPMVRIETDQGYTHDVTPDHKVWVNKGVSKNEGWTEAQDLIPGDKLAIQSKEGLWGNRHNPKAAYVMGLIAGDGTFGDSGVRIDLWPKLYCMVDTVTKYVHNLLKDRRVKLHTNATRKPVFTRDRNADKMKLNSAPLAYYLASKFGFNRSTKLEIPELIWKGDKETVASYLRGIYHTDGTVQGKRHVTTIALSSVNKELLENIQILWLNFGVKSSLSLSRDAVKAEDLCNNVSDDWRYDHKAVYRLVITSRECSRIANDELHMEDARDSEDMNAFLENLKRPGYSVKYDATFTGLTELPSEDAYCLTVDSELHDWVCNGFITKNTEITLPTSNEEIAVCNLGSINLAAHVNDDDNLLDNNKLEETVRTAVRMLDRVIDVNHYPVNKAYESNMRNRPIGLGIMGFQDMLYKQRVPFDSYGAVQIADRVQEQISYTAISESADLVETRCGAFPSFHTGSSYNNYWSYGMTPPDTFEEFKEYREYIGYPIHEDAVVSNAFIEAKWNRLGNKIKVKDSDGAFNGSPGGIRNSNLTAIAPTATIATICGVTSSIEPCFANISTRSNLSGDFTVPNKYLVRELLELGLWNEDIIDKIKLEQGSIQNIAEIPGETKRLFKTAFEIDQKWLIRCAAARQKWIDQSQSLNLYVQEPTGKELDELYKYAWRCGLKTTYYLRSKAKRSAEALSVQSSQEFDENLPAER